MAKKSTASSVRGKQVKKREKPILDRHIDFSDIPELTDLELKQMKRPGRPILGHAKRQLIAIRIDPQILDRLKKEAKREEKGYQSLINEILQEHFKKKAA